MPILLLAPGQGVPILDTEELLASLYPGLGAMGADDLVFWSVDELRRYLNEATRRLATSTLAWIKRDGVGSLAVEEGEEAGDPIFLLPANHIRTFHVSIESRSLRKASTLQLDAFTNTRRTDSDDTPTHYSDDQEDLGRVVIYPAPNQNAGGTVWVVFQTAPDEVTEDETTLEANRTIGDYLSLSVLAEARAKESKGAMPEVAEWARGMAGMLEGAFQQYWGG